MMVLGGWQEARGACDSSGQLIWKLPTFQWPFFVENVRELLDAPREYFVDEAQRRIYYKPVGGADPSRQVGPTMLIHL